MDIVNVGTVGHCDHIVSNEHKALYAEIKTLRAKVALSEPEQVSLPDEWKLIGKASEIGVVWYKQNPHAHPVGTEFYAVLPTTSLTSKTNTEVGE